MRCAIYARYSSDLQRESSIDDQIRKCREYAGLKGWLVLDGYIRSDNAVSGAALAARDALNSLIADAMGRPRPFDRILVDDTSRLARHLADSLTIVERLQFRGVGVVFVSQGIDSLEKTARPLLALNGMRNHRGDLGLCLIDQVQRPNDLLVEVPDVRQHSIYGAEPVSNDLVDRVERSLDDTGQTQLPLRGCGCNHQHCETANQG